MPNREKIVHQLEQTASFLQRFGFGGFENIQDAIAMLIEQEIVRCKDCVYHENEKARSNQTAWLPCMEMQTKNNWYCADGVKKDE